MKSNCHNASIYSVVGGGDIKMHCSKCDHPCTVKPGEEIRLVTREDVTEAIEGLDKMFNAAFHANDSPMLDYITLRFYIKQLERAEKTKQAVV